jgi:hypothetical protein
VVKSAITPPHFVAADPERISQQGSWHRALYCLIKAVYFERVTVVHPDRLPRSGPILYLGLHRNGRMY